VHLVNTPISPTPQILHPCFTKQSQSTHRNEHNRNLDELRICSLLHAKLQTTDWNNSKHLFGPSRDSHLASPASNSAINSLNLAQPSRRQTYRSGAAGGTLSAGLTSIWKLEPLSVFTETFISPRRSRAPPRRSSSSGGGGGGGRRENKEEEAASFLGFVFCFAPREQRGFSRLTPLVCWIYIRPYFSARVAFFCVLLGLGFFFSNRKYVPGIEPDIGPGSNFVFSAFKILRKIFACRGSICTCVGDIFRTHNQKYVSLGKKKKNRRQVSNDEGNSLCRLYVT
jgi:hypothetical protein